MDSAQATLIQQLAAPLQEIRDQARSALVAQGAAAVPALLEALDHPERDARAGAALALGELKTVEALEPLIRTARQDPDPGIRPLALRALLGLAHPGANPALGQALRRHLGDEDQFCRAMACEGLGRLQDKQSRDALSTALQDPEQWVRDVARAALASTPARGEMVKHDPAKAMAQPVRDLQSLDTPVQQRAQQALISQGAAAVQQVASTLISGPDSAKRAAAEVIGAVGDPAGVPLLEQMLDSDDLSSTLQATAMHCLTNIFKRSSPPDNYSCRRILDLVDSDDMYVRGAALAALISARGESLATALERLMEEDEVWVRQLATKTLAEVLEPADGVVTSRVVDLLGTMTAPAEQVSLLSALGRLLQSPDSESQQVVGAVSFFLEQEHPEEVRREAALLLCRIAETVERPVLWQMMEPLQHEAADRAVMTAALGRLCPGGDPRAESFLGRVMHEDDLEAAQEAAENLAAMGSKGAVDSLVELANSRQGPIVAVAAQALARVDPRGAVQGARGPDGRWETRLFFWCKCGDQLRWARRDRYEELRCPRCDLEYVLSPADRLMAAAETPFGLCLCGGCERKQPLVRQGESDVLVCPASQKVHIRPFDSPRQVRLLDDLPLGACGCCAEPQPLIRLDDDVVCYRSRQKYRAAARGFERVDQPRAPQDPAEDVAAINQALLLGSLGIAESGMARPPAGDTEGEDD